MLPGPGTGSDGARIADGEGTYVPIAAMTLACLIVAIADGDTMTARCETPAGLENIKVRLAEIDAPEKGQPFGTRGDRSGYP